MHSRKRPVCDIRIPIRCAEQPGLWDIAFPNPSAARELPVEFTRASFCMMRFFSGFKDAKTKGAQIDRDQQKSRGRVCGQFLCLTYKTRNQNSPARDVNTYTPSCQSCQYPFEQKRVPHPSRVCRERVGLSYESKHPAKPRIPPVHLRNSAIELIPGRLG